MRKQLLLPVLIFTLVSCNDNPNEGQSQEPAPAAQNSISFEEREREEMMKAAASQPQENPYKDAVIEVKSFKDSLGWGYDVFIDNSQYVHQPHIPAVSGNRGFSSEAFARKTGEFVAYKIRNNIMPPSVTPHELDSLGVLK